MNHGCGIISGGLAEASEVSTDFILEPSRPLGIVYEYIGGGRVFLFVCLIGKKKFFPYLSLGGIYYIGWLYLCGIHCIMGCIILLIVVIRGKQEASVQQQCKKTMD